MLSIEKCRKILQQHGEQHTDQEIKQIREALYLFAKYQIDDLENHKI